MVRFAVLLALVACEPMPNPPGNLMAPVLDASPEPQLTQAGDTLSEPSAELFDFDADVAEEEDDGGSTLTDKQLQAKLLGHPIPPSEEPPAPVEDVVKEDVAAPAPAVPVVAPVPNLQPGQALTGNWGIRLVSTVLDADPPRAILGFPDGHEEVVQAGALLPAEGVAVLAIGRNAVQIAEITPAGDHARVESRVISALFPQSAAASSE